MIMNLVPCHHFPAGAYNLWRTSLRGELKLGLALFKRRRWIRTPQSFGAQSGCLLLEFIDGLHELIRLFRQF